MTDTTINNYSLYCITEAALVTTWAQDAPTVCPHNDTHIIDLNSLKIRETISNQVRIVISPAQGTNNFYRAEGFVMNVTAGTGIVSIMDTSFPYATSLRNVYLMIGPENVGDRIQVIANPNTTFGTNTIAVSSGDTVINVSPSVIQNTYPGFLVNLTDGVNNSDLGEIISIDENAGTVTVSTPSSNSFAPGAQFQISISRVKNFDMLFSEKIALGGHEIGGTINPANTLLRTIYTNNSGIAKKFSILAEIFY